MLEALVLTLREGVEAALVVGIIVAFLRKEGGERFLGAVWSGLAVAVVGSAAGAWALYRVAVDEEAFEGVLYVTSAVVVASFVVWMWRHAHAVAGEVRGSLARILARGNAPAVATGLFLFTFLMVFREGVETVLFLAALSLTTQGVLAVLGAAAGLAAAVVFGVLFVRGSVRIDLGRFFKITGIALLIFVVQLLFNGYHELSEAGWVPANETTMAIIGPLVRHEFFFFAAVLALPVLMLWIPSRRRGAEAAPAAAAPAVGTGPASRLERAAARSQRRVRVAASVLGLVVLGVLTAGFLHARPPAPSPPVPVELGADGEVRLPLAGFGEVGTLHRFVAEVDGRPVRFLVVPLGDGELATTFDACLICGDAGYVEEAAGITCLHCHSIIHTPTIGQAGGCNPIPLASRVEGGELVIAAADLAAGGADADGAGGHGGHSGHGTG